MMNVDDDNDNQGMFRMGSGVEIVKSFSFASCKVLTEYCSMYLYLSPQCTIKSSRLSVRSSAPQPGQSQNQGARCSAVPRTKAIVAELGLF